MGCKTIIPNIKRTAPRCEEGEAVSVLIITPIRHHGSLFQGAAPTFLQDITAPPLHPLRPNPYTCRYNTFTLVAVEAWRTRAVDASCAGLVADLVLGAVVLVAGGCVEERKHGGSVEGSTAAGDVVRRGLLLPVWFSASVVLTWSSSSSEGRSLEV